MPAPKPDRCLSYGLVRLFAQHLISTLRQEIGDSCIVWAGHYSSSSHAHPITKGVGAHKISARSMLCPGNPSLPVVMTCSTLGCINPRHMQRVNTARPRDIDQPRVRMSSGQGGHIFGTKSTPEVREQIRARLAAGESQTSVAAETGLSQSTISRIARAK